MGRMYTTLDQALSYRMPFGKFKGEKLLYVYNEDKDYFEWLRANTEGHVKKMVDLIFEDDRSRKLLGFRGRRNHG